MTDNLKKLIGIIADKIDNDFCLSERNVGFIILIGTRDDKAYKTALSSNLYESAIIDILKYVIHKADDHGLQSIESTDESTDESP